MVYDYFSEHGKYPSVSKLKERLNCFRDLIAYRVVISMPSCHVRDKKKRQDEEMKYLYKIANELPLFLEACGFTAEPSGGVKLSNSPLLDDGVRPYYRDYIDGVDENEYRSPHITFLITVHDAIWRCSLRQKRWMTQQKSVQPIICFMKKHRKAQEAEMMLFQRVNAYILMKPMSVAECCRNWNFQRLMSTCLLQ